MPAEQDLAYVETMYASGDDPWRIDTGFYEQRRIELIRAGLPRPRFTRAFEPACASGRLTERLVDRCQELIAADISPRAVELTRSRVPAADVRQLGIPADWPDGRFDLIVLSEFGYYLPPADWKRVVERTRQSLADDWVVLACHWKHPFAERLNPTDWLHAHLAAALPGRRISHLDDEDFALDIWSSAPDSVAHRDNR